jgi:hypothetical protein
LVKRQNLNPLSFSVNGMSEELERYLSSYIQSRVGVFKKYLLAALDNKDHCIWYLESTEGMLVPSSDLKNVQLLRDAQLFTEDVRMSRNGRNTYKIYCLTELGLKLANEIKKEGLEGNNTEKSK